MTNRPSSESATPSDGLPFGRRLRRARMARGWSQLALAQRMFVVAADYGGSATVEALKGMISKWERGRKGVSQENAHLLAETLETTVSALGLPVDPDFVWRKSSSVPLLRPTGRGTANGNESPQQGSGSVRRPPPRR